MAADGKLYGILLSPNVARTAVVARELGIKLTSVHVDLAKGEHKQEPFLSLNPFGSIPVYVSNDESVKLYESRGIARYLDVKTGGKLLSINDPAKYGLIEAWASVEYGTFSQQAGAIFAEKIVKPRFRNLPTDEAVVETNKAALIKTLEIYEKHLATAKTAFLAGNEVSIADLFHLPIGAAVFLTLLPDILNPFPHVKAWFDKISSLPSWQSVHKEQQELFAAFAKK